MKKSLVIALIFVLMMGVLPLAAAQEAQTPEALCAAAQPETPENRTFEQAEQVLEPGVDYHAIFCTGAGAVYVDLYEQYAPLTVNNFVFLAQQGYYNNTHFHRVLADFMAQGGDPTNTGGGDPGYMFQDEFVGFLNFDQPGLLAMANANSPEQGIVGTNGGQFFITTAPTPHLDYRHTIFGKVLAGQENVEALELRDPNSAPTSEGSPLDTVLIVTDPATVESDYVAPALATKEDVAAAFAGLEAQVTQMADFLSVDNAAPEALDTEAAAATAPESLQSAFGEFLTSHNHEYQIGISIVNTACDLTGFPIAEMRYTLNTFATPEDAGAALEDGFFGQLQTENGLTESQPETLNYPLYTGTTTACDVEVNHAVTHWQRGRFIVTIEMKYQEVENMRPADDLLSQLAGVQLFELSFTDILRPEAG